jgi:hypothetical protein
MIVVHIIFLTYVPCEKLDETYVPCEKLGEE